MYNDNNASKSGGILATIIKILIYGFFAVMGIYFVVQFCRELFSATLKGVNSLTDFLDNLAVSLISLPFNIVDSIINWIFH